MLQEQIKLILNDRASRHQLRQRRVVRSIDATHVDIDGRRVTNFCSNDYLGLSKHPRMIEVLKTAENVGAGASALIAGYTPDHAAAESELARWKGVEASILLPSGYQANVAIVQTLSAIADRVGRPAQFIVDKLVHASLIDAVRMAGRPMRVMPHGGLHKLRRLLDEPAAEGFTNIVLTESIFSMDGDAADLAGLARLKRDYNFVLVVDEAHATGLYGPCGAGLVHGHDIRAAVDATVVTFSKALGFAGGAICGSRMLVEAVVNLARAYIYSTAVPAASGLLLCRAIEVVEAEPWRRKRVLELAGRLRSRVGNSGLSVPPGDSPIIPIILGQEEVALSAAGLLLEKGFLVTAIRPPTVAPGRSRLRVTLSAEHTDEEVDALAEVLAVFGTTALHEG